MTRKSLLSAAVALAAASLALAQGTPTLSSLQRLHGDLYGAGDDYQAHFTPGTFEFLPALGSAAPRDLPVQFTLESVGRQHGQPVPASELARPHEVQRGTSVDYVRGSVTETYDVRVDGVEQSFTFRTLPAGGGDLVVRGRIETDLAARSIRDGVEFFMNDVGGVTVSKVIGIDAAGMRTPGTLSFEDGVLELRLPGEFVETAQLPLVLDPLFGTTIDVDSTANDQDNQDPDIAYDAANDNFYCVFERQFSAINVSIMGQVLNGDLTLQSANLVVAISGLGVSDPTVANVRFNERFVVAWRDTAGIQGKSVRGANGVSGPQRLLVANPGGGFALEPDLGGESTMVDDEAILVWTNTVTDDIYARQIRPLSDDTLSLNGGQVLISGTGTQFNNQPAISKSGGSTGYHMIVWHENVNGRDRVISAIVNRNLGFIDANTPLTSNNDEHFNPDVDGDGRLWVAAYEREEPTNPTETDIAVRGVTINDALFGSDNAILFAENLIEASPLDDDRNPKVCFLGSSALVAYEDEGVNPSEYDVRIWNVDPFTAESCTGFSSVEFGLSRNSIRIEMASKRAGDADSDSEQAAIIWESTVVATGNSDVFARAWLANDDGDMIDQGGGCGGGGLAYATCAEVGNLDFTHRLFTSHGGATTWFVLSPQTINAFCGSCTLVPDVFNAFVYTTTTDILGRASVVTPIPSVTALAGISWYEQWATDPSGASSCAAWGVDFSNALRVTIED